MHFKTYYVFVFVHYRVLQFSTSEYITWNEISVTDVYQRGQVPIIITIIMLCPFFSYFHFFLYMHGFFQDSFRSDIRTHSQCQNPYFLPIRYRKFPIYVHKFGPLIMGKHLKGERNIKCGSSELLLLVTVGMVIFVFIIFALDSNRFNNGCQMISNEVKSYQQILL